MIMGNFKGIFIMENFRCYLKILDNSLDINHYTARLKDGFKFAETIKQSIKKPVFKQKITYKQHLVELTDFIRYGMVDYHINRRE